MLFIVSRVSGAFDSQPVEEARLKKLKYIDSREVDHPDKLPYYDPSKRSWFEDGKNHKVVDGKMQREFIRERYCVQISSIASLKAFVSLYGDCIIGYGTQHKMNTITIYDDYIE